MRDDILESETLTASSGRVYTLQYLRDDNPSDPYDDDYMQSDIVVGENDDYSGLAAAGKHGASVLGDRVFDQLRHSIGTRSERAVARYLLLAGMHGVTLVNRSRYDGKLRRQRVHAGMLDELGTSLDDKRAQCDGFAWLTPEALENLSDGADYFMVVADEVDTYEAYLSGDVFGYQLRDADGNAVEDATGWGYLGLERERAHVKNEAIDAMDRHDVATVAAEQAAREYAIEAARVKAAELDAARRAQAVEAQRLLDMRIAAQKYRKSGRGAADEAFHYADTMAALILDGE